MKYALLVLESDHGFESRSHPERAGAYWASYQAFSAALVQAGVMAPGGAPLELPTLSTTLRVRDGKRTVQDGPFADTKEQLGGMFIIDVPTLDEALEWAARCPAAEIGAVEVRPILAMPPMN